MTKRLNLILLALFALIGVPYWWLLLDSPHGAVEAKPLSLARLEQLAAFQPGLAPNRVEVELVAFRHVPGNIMAAGIGMKRRMIGAMAFRLPVEGRGGIMIDSGLPKSDADCQGFSEWRPEAQRRIDRALRSASLILVTHEHPDHMGGIAKLTGSAGDGGLLTRIRLNQAQAQPEKSRCPADWPRGIAIQPTIPPDGPFAVAPGVVVIPAPSHTPGSQMIFVRLTSGKEYLFTGDIASLTLNWRDLRPRSRLLGTYIAPENRDEVLSWLMTIQKLKSENPALIIVPGHDYEWLIDPTNKTGLIQMQ